MTKKIVVDEPLLRLTAGMLQAMQCLILALESSGSLDRQRLEFLVDGRMGSLPEDDLSSVPLAMLAQFLRPHDPPPPILRLVKG